MRTRHTTTPVGNLTRWIVQAIFSPFDGHWTERTSDSLVNLVKSIPSTWRLDIEIEGVLPSEMEKFRTLLAEETGRPVTLEGPSAQNPFHLLKVEKVIPEEKNDE